MKRYLALMLAILLAFTFISCEPEPPQMVNITLDAGVGEPEVIQVVKGSEYQIPEKTREGRTLDKIVDTAGKTYKTGDRITVTGDLKLTWVWAKVTVTLDIGNGTSETFEYEQGSEYTIPEKTREGRTLEKIVDAAGKTYKTGDRITVAGDLKLTWVWAKVTVTLDIGNGTSETFEYEQGSEYTIPEKTRDDFTLLHIYDDANKDHKIGETIVLDKDIKLRYRWNKAVLTITVDDNKTVEEIVATEKRYEFPINHSKSDEVGVTLVSLTDDLGKKYSNESDSNWMIFYTDVHLTCEWDNDYVITIKDGDKTITGYQSKAEHTSFEFPEFRQADDGTWANYGIVEGTGKKIPITKYRTSSDITVNVVRTTEPYLIDPEGKSIIGYYGKDKEITLPTKVDDIGILGISNFKSNFVKKLTMPDEYTYIFDSAFMSNETIEEVIFSPNLNYIGSYAFYESSLVSADLSQTKVTELSEKSFYSYYAGKLTKLVLPKGLTTIKNSAFTSPILSGELVVDIPASVVDVAENCFGGSSTSLTLNIITKTQTETWDPEWQAGSAAKVNYGDDVEHEGLKLNLKKQDDGSLAYEVRGLVEGNESKNITIPSSYKDIPVIGIGTGAFADKIYITNVIIPESVQYIGENAFNNCWRLTDVEFSKGLKKIGNSAFQGASLINVTELPENLESIGASAFEKSKIASGKTLTLNSGLTSIGRSAFERSTFKEIILPTTLKNIGSMTFSYSSIEKIIIPQGVETIGNSVFSECSALTEITFNSPSLKLIPTYAFDNCINLTTVNFSEGLTSIDTAAFFRCTKLVSLKLPESLKEIIGGQIVADSGIESIVIPANVEKLHPYAFSKFMDGKHLTSVEFKREIPPAITNNYVLEENDIIVYVPDGSVQAYKEWASNYGFKPENVKVKPATT